MPNQQEKPYVIVSGQTLAELENEINELVVNDRYAIMPGIIEHTDEKGDKWYVKEAVAIYLAKWSNGLH